MMIKIDDDVPAPAGRSTGSRDSSEVTDAILSLRPGQSFFAPATDCSAAVLQRRITVRSVGMRERGRIQFFLTTRQTIEGGVSGVRVWRREAEVLEDESHDVAEHHEESAV